MGGGRMNGDEAWDGVSEKSEGRGGEEGGGEGGSRGGPGAEAGREEEGGEEESPTKGSPTGRDGRCKPSRRDGQYRRYRPDRREALLEGREADSRREARKRGEC